MKRDCGKAGDVKCPSRGEEGGERNVGEECSMWNEECPERGKVDGRRSLLRIASGIY